jgi:hypothetical protein
VGGLRAGSGNNIHDLHAQLHTGVNRQVHHAGRLSRRRTGGSGRSASPRWKIDRPAGRRRGAQRHLRGGLPGSSYGFRPGCSPHHALDALAVGIERKKVNWVPDREQAHACPRSPIRQHLLGQPVPQLPVHRRHDHLQQEAKFGETSLRRRHSRKDDDASGAPCPIRSPTGATVRSTRPPNNHLDCTPTRHDAVAPI